MTLRPASNSADIDELIASAGGGVPDSPADPAGGHEHQSSSNPRVVRRPRVEKRPKVGRPRKEKTEKRNQKVTLSLTDAEREKVKEKSGMVAEATYLLSVLRQSGVFD